MILCDRDWSVFGVGEAEFHVPISLDHLVALFEMPSLPRLKDVSASVHEIKLIFNLSGLRTLNKLYPTQVLMLGEMRYCSNTDRAVAIMSALGTTEWYNQSLSGSTQSTPDTLVNGKYQLVFLRECHSRFGAFFFASVHISKLDAVFYESAMIDGTELNYFKGSMIPFSSGMQDTRYMFDMLMGVEDHPAVAGWVIQPDGSVQISRAGIIASSLDYDAEPIKVDTIPVRMDFRHREQPDELHA